MSSISPRKDSQGNTVWHARVRVKGAAPQSKVFPNKTHAKRWAQSTEAAIRERRFFPKAEEARRTVGEAIDRYLEELPLRQLRDERSRRRQLTWWRGKLGHLLLADLTAARIVELRDELLRTPILPNSKHRKGPLRQRGPATVVRYLAALSHVLRTAKREWGWLSSFPMEDVRKPREPSGRVRYLSDDELASLLAACSVSESSVLNTIVVLALTTGMRRGEIRGLRWVDVDIKRAQLTLVRTKNGERRSLPLVGPALKALEDHSARRQPGQVFVFPGARPDAPVDIKRSWATAVKRAGLQDFRFHDLRHTAASYLAMCGCTALEIAEILGHKQLQMVKRYAHVSVERLRMPLDRMSEFFLFPGPGIDGKARVRPGSVDVGR